MELIFQIPCQPSAVIPSTLKAIMVEICLSRFNPRPQEMRLCRRRAGIGPCGAAHVIYSKFSFTWIFCEVTCVRGGCCGKVGIY